MVTPMGTAMDQHHRAQHQRDAEGVDDAAEDVAADEIGAEDVGPFRRAVEVREIDHRAAVLGEGRDEIGEDRREDHDEDEHQAQQRHRVAQEDVEGALHGQALCEWRMRGLM
jgi:hypothetical protein